MLKRLAALIALFGFVFVAPATAEKRVALVIGNSAYVHAPALANPKNDAEGMAGALRRLKFEVIAGTDLDKLGMERALRQFSNAIERADVALVFYAGHGLQVNGRNYLIPVDARLEKENDLRFDAVSLDDLQQIMELAQRVNIVILDACRDNPLARNLARSMGTRSTSIGRGLGETKAGVGTLIVYATQPGNVALDGDGKNSPFTKAMLKYIEEPGLEIRQVLTRVRNEVITSTRDRQVPWDSSSLRGDFFFMTAAARPPEPPPPATPPRGPSAEFETLFWQSIKDSTNAADFKAYLERWPNGVFAPLARIRIAALERPQPQANRGTEADRKPADSGRGQADVVARLARDRLDRAKAALGGKRYVEAKRLAAESDGLVKEARQISAASPEAAAAERDLKAFRLELDKELSARVAILLREAKALIDARKFGEADERLDEAENLQPASATALRRQLESARARANADAGKGADDAKRSLPDAARGQTAHSWYNAGRKRGLLGFAYRKTTLEPSATAALDSLVASLRNQGDYRIRLYAAADRSEGAGAELQSLSRARLAAVQQYLTGKGIPPARLQTGVAAVRGEGPAQRIVTIGAEVAAAPAKPEKPGSAPADATNSAELLRRISGAQWGGTLSGSVLNAPFSVAHSAIISFRAGGVFKVVAVPYGHGTGSARVAVDDTGSWSVSNGRVCITLPRIVGGQPQCYAASIDQDGRVTLAGSGLLAGKRFSR